MAGQSKLMCAISFYSSGGSTLKKYQGRRYTGNKKEITLPLGRKIRCTSHNVVVITIAPSLPPMWSPALTAIVATNLTRVINVLY